MYKYCQIILKQTKSEASLADIKKKIPARLECTTATIHGATRKTIQFWLDLIDKGFLRPLKQTSQNPFLYGFFYGQISDSTVKSYKSKMF